MEALLALIAPAIPLVVLVSVRVAIVLASLPAPFGEVAPVRVRALLSVLIALALALPLMSQPQTLTLDTVVLARAAVGEVLVGAVIGLTARVTLAAAEIAGNLAGMSMGLSFATTVDPTFGEQTSPPGQLMASFGVLIFLILQGHHVVLTALAASLRTAPPGDSFGVLANDGVIRIGSSMLAHGLRIAAPVIATMFIVQLGTALVARAAPRVQMFALTFAIASTAGMLTLFIAAPSLAPGIATQLQTLQEALRVALGGS